MSEYKIVKSGLEISRQIADCLEDIDPIQYNGQNRARRLRNVNSFLQGRNDMPLNELLDWTEQAQGGAYAAGIQAIRQDIQQFQEQKALLETPHTRRSRRAYSYRIWDMDPENPLKIIDQALYDQAAQEGFPSGFFRDSYFDHVTVYCLPDSAVCDGSRFQSCTFAVCRLVGTDFRNATLDDCEFHTCKMQDIFFTGAVISHTHFRDCSMHNIRFLHSRMKSCNTIDCTVGRLNFAGSRLDGCSYDRIHSTPRTNIRNLHTAEITMGGATAEECRENRTAIFRALRVPEPKEKDRRPGPER
nr:pentapeptide repeat-containing protein [uncultured Oscillibacter sp.]